MMMNLLGSRMGWSNEVGKLEAHNPMEEINLAEEGEKPRPMFVSSLLEPT